MRIERKPTLVSSFQSLQDRTKTIESLQQNQSAPSIAIAGPRSVSNTTAANILWEANFTTTYDALLEVYAHAIGNTNEGGQYAQLRVYIDDEQVYADYVLQWGSPSSAVNDERRRTLQGSHLGTVDRLGGFVVAQNKNSELLTAGDHWIAFELWGAGSRTAMPFGVELSDIVLAFRSL
jgi:hypothetical protein